MLYCSILMWWPNLKEVDGKDAVLEERQSRGGEIQWINTCTCEYMNSVHHFSPCSFNKERLSESLISPAETLRSVKQLLHSDMLQEIIDDPLHGILRRHVGKSFSIFDLADETNAPGLLCQFSLLRVKQSGFPGPAMRRVREQPSWKCLLSSTKWCNVAFHLAPLCYLSLTEL